jgi:hypothetical protein
MYCEITVKHRNRIDEVPFKALISRAFGNGITLPQAYGRSEVYKAQPEVSSICAFDSGSNCFVILRKVTNVRLSIFHFEGNNRNVTVTTMLEAMQDFIGELVAQLQLKTVNSAYRPGSVSVRLFEDNAKETGLLGARADFWSGFKKGFALKEIIPSLVALVSAALLLWFGLDSKQPLRTAICSLGVVVLFKLVETVGAYISKRDTIEWKLTRELVQ